MKELFNKSLDSYEISGASFQLCKTIVKDQERLPILSVLGALKIVTRFPYDIINSDDCTGNIKADVKLVMKGFSNELRHELFRELEEHNNTTKKENPAQALYKEIRKYIIEKGGDGEAITEIILVVRGYREIHPAQVRIVFS